MLKKSVFILMAFTLWSCDLSPPEGRFICNEDDDCPPDWICHTDSRCYSSEDAIDNTQSTDDSDEDNTDSATENTDSDSDAASDSDSETNGTDDGT